MAEVAAEKVAAEALAAEMAAAQPVVAKDAAGKEAAALAKVSRAARAHRGYQMLNDDDDDVVCITSAMKSLNTVGFISSAITFLLISLLLLPDDFSLLLESMLPLESILPELLIE